MSVLETHDDERPANLLHYAPRGARVQQDDGTIRPILERLSRGDGGADRVRDPASARVDFEPRAAKRIPWAFIACCAVSAALSAGVAIAAVGWIGSGANEAKRTEAIDLAPKSVHTVSFRQDASAKETTAIAPAAEPAPARVQTAESAPTPVQTASVADDAPAAPAVSAAPAANPLLSAAPRTPPKELLARWSGVPADVAAQPPNEPPPQPAAKDDAPSASQPERHHPHAVRHTRHGQAHTRRHRHAAAHTARAQASAPAPQVVAQPDANPLQALFRASASTQAQSNLPVTRSPQ